MGEDDEVVSEGKTMRLAEACEVFIDNLDDIIEAVSSNLVDDLEEEQAHMREVRSHLETDDEMVLSYELQLMRADMLFSARSRALRQIIAYKGSINSPNKRGIITPQMIERARQYPLKELVSEKLNRSGVNYSCRCPFHTERTASFYIFTKSNRFKCFGCGEGGDVIDYYCKLNNATFPEAVKYLSK